MWSQVLLCLLVGFAAASHTPAWKDNTEYVYEVRARSLASLHELGDDYSGVLLKAMLKIQPGPDGILNGQISQPQFAPVHAQLSKGWKTVIPDSELAYNPLPISQQPFQIILKNSAVRDLVVSKDISNWEANIIKSIVAQFQVDTKADNLIPSHINILTQDKYNNAVFKTMEETVTGVAETLYEIHPLPEQALQDEPSLAPKGNLGDGQLIEVIKTKNFTRSDERPSYHFGFVEMGNAEPGSNRIGDALIRTSVCRSVISGDLKSYTIQSSVTIDQIIVSPTLSSQQKGSVSTMVNVTLISVNSQQPQQLQQPSNPINLGSLVYRYDEPFSTSNNVRSRKPYEHQTATGSAEADGSGESNILTNDNRRFRRMIMGASAFEIPDYSSSVEEEDWQQPKPRLGEAPAVPLVPLNVGYNGQSYKKKRNIVEETRKLVQEIAKDYQKPSEMPKKNTMSKFVGLCSLLRILDQNEVQEIASQLYSKEEHGVQETAWDIFRDGVAQAGTGPALIAIQDWIKTKKIREAEAAHVIATAADAAREPTEEYMRAFYQMIISPEVMEQKYLNESALLSYTTLINQVYVNKQYAHDKYPIYIFSSFRTRAGQDFLTSQVIPYLAQKLHESVSQADIRNIHLYIRALGNVGHQHILQAFEQYLEGRKQASQFQRVLMVAAMDKLVKSKPAVARSVLYKIYQNPSEYDEVRAAAVYQLIRTHPPPQMLQRMAEYTNIDPSEYVNSAVQSTIESASELKGADFEKLRSAAKSALHLLTKKRYGAQFSQGKLRSYVEEHQEFSYKQSLRMFGGEDEIIPRGFAYAIRGRFGGIHYQLANMHAVVSSIDDLVNVYNLQTQMHRDNLEEKRAQRGEQQKWTSEYIAKLLNMDNEQREQLEGNLFLQFKDLQKIYSFDNKTFEQLPKILAEIEKSLQSKKHYHHHKTSMPHELAVSYPTALGVPFIYTYDKPTYFSFESQLKASANPSISGGKYLQKPDEVSGEFGIRVVIASKAQGQIGFITPFDHQRYAAGYDKNFQADVELSGKILVDVKRMQVKFELDGPSQDEERAHFLHYSTWPYTSKGKIFTAQPQRKITNERRHNKIDQVIGHKSTGIAVRLQVSSDRKIDAYSMYEKLIQHDPISALVGPWAEDYLHHMEVDVKIDVSKSSTRKIVGHFGYQHKYQPRRIEENNSGADIGKLRGISSDPLKRQKEFMKRCGADIDDVHTRVYDATVEFQGQQKIGYTATFAYGKSNVNPKARFLGQALRSGGYDQPLEIYVSGKSHVPNTNGLDLSYAMKFDPTVTSQIQASIGESYEKSTKFDAQVQYRKTENRKQYLTELPEYQECQRQMQQGNYQLPACAKMTAQANLLDKVSISVKYQNMEYSVANQTYSWYSLIRHMLYPRVEEDLTESQRSSQDQVDIEGQFSPDLESVSVSIQSKLGLAKLENIPVSQWAKEIFVPHPVFHIRSRLMGKAYGYDVYRPYCVIDKNAASTFDNKTYPAKLGNHWTILLQYVPRRPSSDPQHLPVHEQLKQHVDSYIVYTRAYQGNADKKEIKMVIQSPNTQGKVVVIEIKPSDSGKLPKLYINGEEIKFNLEHGASLFDGYLQIYGLPNDEVKLEIYQAFYVIYDGYRGKLTIVDDKFRDASRGLCGTFTGEPQTDFVAPNGCILQDPEEFVASYTILEGGEQNQRILQLRESAAKKPCYQKRVKYVNVISSADSGRMSSDDKDGFSSSNSCSKLQTKYVMDGGRTCFTLRPLPSCKSSCQKRGRITKTVPVHCVESSSAASLWKKEIDKGASPDFSQKKQTKSIRMEVPQSCVA